MKMPMEMMRLTEKRAGVLRALYRRTELEIWDFMDKSDLSFACIDVILNGDAEYITDGSIRGFAKGFDMTEAELRAYLEIGDFF